MIKILFVYIFIFALAFVSAMWFLARYPETLGQFENCLYRLSSVCWENTEGGDSELPDLLNLI